MQAIRYTKDQIKRDYDKKYDILKIIFGDTDNSYEDCDDPKFGLIRDMYTDQLVGITCYGYKRFNLHDAMIETLLQNGVSISL